MNLGMVIQQGFNASSGGGWVLVDSEQATSDVASISFTGLSGYRHIRIVCVWETQTTGANVTVVISGRVAAGTYRDSASSPNLTTANAVRRIISGVIDIHNVNTTDTFKVVSVNLGGVDDTLDNTNAVSAWGAAGSTAISFVVSYQEVWDDIKITPSQNIEGSTAGERGFFYVFGMV